MIPEFLRSTAGRLRGPSTLEDPESGVSERCDSEARLAPVAAGRFARLDYTWSYRGTPQDGSLLVGVDPASGRCTAHWVDSWHMGHVVMACEGSAEGEGLSVRGSYTVPGHPDWGWRIALDPAPGEGLRLRMWNVSPAGEEYPAVEALYAPEPASDADAVTPSATRSAR